MGADLQTEILRRAAFLTHTLDLCTQLLSGKGNMGVPVDSVVGKPQAAEVCIAIAVTKPPSHLEQGVIHLRISEEIARSQAFERQAAGQAVAADSDHAQA